MLSQTYFHDHSDAPPGDHRVLPERSKELIGTSAAGPCLLACVDVGNNAQLVVEHAAAIARSLDLQMHIATVIEDDGITGSPVDPIQWKLRTQEHTGYLGKLARHAGINRESATVLLHGSPPEELIDWSIANGGTLLALATQSGVHQYSLGPTALRILEHGTASLLLVPSNTGETASYRRILVPIDGSPRSESVVPIARRIARAMGSELILAHVLPRIEQNFAFSPPSAVSMRAQIERENAMRAREHLDQLRLRSSDPSLNVQSVVLDPADPRQATCEFASNNDIDLVVMSSHGATALNDVPCGSVTEYLASHCTMPLLLVRPNLVAGFGTDEYGLDGQSVFRFD